MSEGERISGEEFALMVDELLYGQKVRYDALCNIAERVLRRYINNLCARDPALQGRGFENDIMQEVQLRLIKTTIPYFLLRDGADGRINYDPDGFCGWLYTVALNIKKDFAARIRTSDFRSAELDDRFEPSSEGSPEDIFSQEDTISRLKDAMSIVIFSDSRIYKILTWIAQFVFILNCNITKKESNEMIILQFKDKTLTQMYEIICRAAKKLPWLELSEEERAVITGALDREWDDTRTYGEVKYGEFLMKKGDISTVSDWMNRMNNYVRRVAGKWNI